MGMTKPIQNIVSRPNGEISYFLIAAFRTEAGATATKHNGTEIQAWYFKRGTVSEAPVPAHHSIPARGMLLARSKREDQDLFWASLLCEFEKTGTSVGGYPPNRKPNYQHGAKPKRFNGVTKDGSRDFIEGESGDRFMIYEFSELQNA